MMLGMVYCRLYHIADCNEKHHDQQRKTCGWYPGTPYRKMMGQFLNKPLALRQNAYASNLEFPRDWDGPC